MNKVTIDLFDFIKSGKFDCIKIGQTREWILNNFPNPDGFNDGGNWRNGEFEIFTYGDFELHFSNDILFLIFADFAGEFDPGKSLLFSNKWFFEKDTSQLNVSFVINELIAKRINFSTTINKKLFSVTLKIDKIEIQFESDESTDPLDYIFSAIWIKEKI